MSFPDSIDLSKTRDREQKTDGHQNNYVSHRAKIGVVIPSTNISVEYDCQRIIPRGVTWHTTRFLIEHPDLSDDKNFIAFLEMLRETIGDSIASLMTCKPDHVMMGMSAETFWGGIEGNDGFVDRIQEAVGEGMGLTTGANSLISALEALDIVGNTNKKVSVITPYQPVGDKNVRLFLEDSGFEIKHLVGLRCENATDAIALNTEKDVLDIIREIDGDDVDAIIQVGTNLSTAGVFPVMEKMLNKPVLPINVATIWHALRSCGIKDQFDNMGRLLEEH
jgi:maleate isomerase